MVIWLCSLAYVDLCSGQLSREMYSRLMPSISGVCGVVRNQMVPPCVEWWSETDNQATTPFDYCPSMAFLRVWPHCVNAWWIDAKKISSLENWRRETTGMTLYYVDEDYPARPEIQQPLPGLPEWSNESPTLETDVCVWCYSLRVVHARNEWMDELTTWAVPAKRAYTAVFLLRVIHDEMC